MDQGHFDAAVADLLQSVGLLVRRARAAAAAEQISMTEAAVMGRLARKGPATTAELARAEGMKPQSMGATVAALEAMGLVERKPHATDGRQMDIVLTEKGAEVRKSRSDAKRTWLGEAVSRLPEQEQRILFEAGEIIRRLADPIRAGREGGL